MKQSDTAPALLLSPHLDDAVLSCWSLLNSDQPLEVVTVFAGIPPAGGKGTYDEWCWQNFPSFKEIMGNDLSSWDSRDVVNQRRKEDANALEPTKRASIYLDLFDSQYAQLTGGQGDFEDFQKGLEAHFQECSQLYVPAALSKIIDDLKPHSDHVLVRDWGKALAGTKTPIHLYADLPYGFRADGVNWINESGIANAEQHQLDEASIQQKLVATHRYATQWPVLTEVWARGEIDLEMPTTWQFEATGDAG